MMNTASKRVAHGAQMLDLARPGWHRDLDLSTLNLSDCEDCVLGQLYGSYDAGKDALGLFFGTAESYGFYSSRLLRPYHALTRAWRRETRRRRKADRRGPEVLVTWVDEVADFRAELVDAP